MMSPALAKQSTGKPVRFTSFGGFPNVKSGCQNEEIVTSSNQKEISRHFRERNLIPSEVSSDILDTSNSATSNDR
jgi:hypothetical protein